MKTSLTTSIGRALTRSFDDNTRRDVAVQENGNLSRPSRSLAVRSLVSMTASSRSLASKTSWLWRTLSANDEIRRVDISENVRLARLLRSKWNYHRVQLDMMRSNWSDRGRATAFVSTALRQIGVNVPKNRLIGGLNVSQVTWALSRHLQDYAGWRRFEDVSRFVAGDIVFTEKAPCCPEIPHHVFVFMGWENRERGIARVIDSNGFMVTRAMFGTGTSSCDHTTDQSPAAYALRAPHAVSALQRASA